MKNLSRKQKKELRPLASKPDSEIDLTDILEIVDWTGAVVGKFYRPIKKSLTIRVDADVASLAPVARKGLPDSHQPTTSRRNEHAGPQTPGLMSRLSRPTRTAAQPSGLPA